MTKISTMLEADPQKLEGLESNIFGLRVADSRLVYVATLLATVIWLDQA